MKQPTKHAKSGSSVELVNERLVDVPLQFFGQPKIIVTVIKPTKWSPQKKWLQKNDIGYKTNQIVPKNWLQKMALVIKVPKSYQTPKELNHRMRWTREFAQQY